MASKDTSEIKDKIVSVFTRNGPCLPSKIAKETGLSILFASAFLSELISEGRVKISSMRIGNSPIYFAPGQEEMLDSFSDELKSKEKDAFNLLKKNGFLKDSEQEPAIRVALRSIKDFAFPFKKDNQIYWRYLKVNEKDLRETDSGVEVKKDDINEEPKKENIKEEFKEKQIDETKEKSVEEKTDETKKVKKSDKKKSPKKTTSKKRNIGKNNDKFFNKIKEFLSKNSIEMMSIEGASKNDIILRVRDNEEEKLLFAYNKKRINESDLLKAYKKASDSKIKFIILSGGEFPKKLGDLIKAAKLLSKTEKLN